MRSGRREAVAVTVMWCLATIWSVGYSGWAGYGPEYPELRFVLGIPVWVFWGVVAPWLLCAVISVWFALRFMSDDDLGNVTEGTSASQEQPHA